jgi:hypothetical protein
MTMNTSILSRRQALQQTGTGLAWLAFSALAQRDTFAANSRAPQATHFPARAKRVIMLTMPGGPSHVDTFDYKPQLIKDHLKDGRSGKFRGAKLMAPQWKFRQHGQGGLWISDLFPHVATMADELCLLRGMHTDIPDHDRAQLQMHTGNFQFARPSLGVWSLYGLGSESENLPGFVWMSAGKASKQVLSNSFLPAQYQGTSISLPKGGGGSAGGRGRKRGADQPEGLPNIANPRLNPTLQRQQLDFVQALNRDKLDRAVHQPGIDGVIESYELGFRMQAHLPATMDLSQETQDTLDLYGVGGSETDEFGRKCLQARRFAEAGVRFIALGHGPGWDNHGDLREKLPESCAATDKPIAGLLKDLKQRDMLKDTLVIWSGEFGRSPHSQGGNGRDHNAKGYTSWMAGAGVKGGFSYGGTDEHGYEAVTGKTHIHDWHATILHLLGLDHERLTYRHAGRDFRLTDVKGQVAKEILA